MDYKWRVCGLECVGHPWVDIYQNEQMVAGGFRALELVHRLRVMVGAHNKTIDALDAEMAEGFLVIDDLRNALDERATALTEAQADIDRLTGALAVKQTVCDAVLAETTRLRKKLEYLESAEPLERAERDRDAALAKLETMAAELVNAKLSAKEGWHRSYEASNALHLEREKNNAPLGAAGAKLLADMREWWDKEVALLKSEEENDDE